MTDSQKGSLPRQPGWRLPRRSGAVLPDLGHDRWPSARVLLVKHHAQGPRELGHVLLPLLQLAESRVPLGDRLVALDLPGQARYRDGVGTATANLPYSSPSNAFRSARSARSLRLGSGELSRGVRRYGVVYPRRRLAAGIRSGGRRPLRECQRYRLTSP